MEEPPGTEEVQSSVPPVLMCAVSAVNCMRPVVQQVSRAFPLQLKLRNY